MEILRNKKDDNANLYISQERPAFFVNNSLYKTSTSSKKIFSDEDIKEISKFYCSNYKIGKSNVTHKISINDLKRFLNLDCELLTIRKDNLIGSMLSIYVPVTINLTIDKTKLIETSERFDNMKSHDSIMFACASYLILSRKYRGKGYGMALIQESLQVFYDYGGLTAYFINSVSRCINSIPLYSWIFPLNLSKLDRCNFNYPSNYKSLFNLKNNLTYTTVKINRENSLQALNFYHKFMKDKKLYFSPSKKYWLKWVKTFPTYMVFNNDEIIGLYCFNHEINYYPINKEELLVGSLLLCVGQQPQTLKNALLESKKYYDLVKIYETGDMNKKILNTVNAIKTEPNVFINFFNNQLFLKSSDIYIPLF